MIQALLHARKKMYGPSTEVTRQVEGQMSLFASIEELAKELEVEQKKVTVNSYTRITRQPGIRKEMLKNLPMEVEEYILPPEENCSVYGSPLVIMGRKVVRSEVEFVPAKLIVKQVIQQVVKCSICGTAAGENPSCHFQAAAVPVPPLAYSLSTPSLIAQVMYQKYVLGLPLA